MGHHKDAPEIAARLQARRSEWFALREHLWNITPPGGWQRCYGAPDAVCGNPGCRPFHYLYPCADGSHAGQAEGGTLYCADRTCRPPKETRRRVRRLRCHGGLQPVCGDPDCQPSHDAFDRPRRCGRSGGFGGHPGINRRFDLATGWRASLSGVETCGSVWVCPPCSAKIRHKRGLRLETALRAHLDAGGGAEFVVFTVRHSQQMALAPLLDAVFDAFRRRIVSGSQWVADQETYGIRGWVRSTEITWSFANGWHPHQNLVLLTERPLTDTERSALRARLSKRWAAMVAAIAGEEVRPDDEHGVRMSGVWSGEVGLYITKMMGTEKAHSGFTSEMLRGDLKEGRSGSLVPWDILAFTGSDTAFAGRARALWWEYETATKGRRLMSWSKGLREMLGSADEAADVQLALEVEPEAERIYTFDSLGQLWKVANTPGLLHTLLTIAEAGGTTAEVEAAIRAVVKARTGPPEDPPPQASPPPAPAWREVPGQINLRGVA